MEIEIIYQAWSDSEPVQLSLTPEEYFDPLEPGETYAEDAIARFNHTWQYLDVPRSALKWSVERLSGTNDDRTIRTQYMDSGKSWMTHRSDPNGYEEIIHVTQLTERRCHILRTFKQPGGGWALHLNSVIEDQEGGSQTEQRFDAPWSFTEAQHYSRLATS